MAKGNTIPERKWKALLLLIDQIDLIAVVMKKAKVSSFTLLMHIANLSEIRRIVKVAWFDDIKIFQN